jgi:Na+/H+ antiporter NhaC
MPVVDEDIITIEAKPGVKSRLGNMFIPLAAMVVMVPLGIFITGRPGLAEVAPDAAFTDKLHALLNEASGSLSVLWGVTFGLVMAAVIMRLQGIFKTKEIVDLSFKGAGGLIPLAVIMCLAFAIGTVCNKLGTGPWVAAQVKDFLSPALIAPIVFLVSCFIAFSTGTSWGTFAIMIPLALPLAASFNMQGTAVSIPLVVSAVMGGGVFGDHCSPISDTTVVSSMAACSDHIDHVRTQIPYAFLAATVTLLLYLVIGILM